MVVDEGLREYMLMDIAVGHGYESSMASPYIAKNSYYALDKKGKKSYYEQWKSDAFAWANKKSTKIGDMSSGSDSQYVYFYRAIDADNEGKATDYEVVTKIPFKDEEIINEWYAEVEKNNERNHASVYESIDEYERVREKYQSYNTVVVGKQGANGRSSGVYKDESDGNGKRDTSKGSGNKRYSLDVNIEEKIKKHYDKCAIFFALKWRIVILQIVNTKSVCCFLIIFYLFTN